MSTPQSNKDPNNPILALDTINPRHQREKWKDWVGKRVIVGLTTDHYLCGTWESTGEDNRVAFKIGEHDIKVAIGEIDNVAAASSFQSDFYK